MKKSIYIFIFIFGVSFAQNNNFQMEWQSYQDIKNTIEAPNPTVQTSIGLISYQNQGREVSGYKIFRGYDNNQTLRSILVYNGTYISLTFLLDEGSITISASPDSFNIKQGEEEKCKTDHLIDVIPPLLTPTGRPTARNTFSGKGSMLGVKITDNNLKNYRLVFGTSEEYLEAKGQTKESIKAIFVMITEALNSYFERDFGIHFILVLTDQTISKKDFHKGQDDLRKQTTFFNNQIGEENYDIGVYIGGGVEHEYAGLAYLRGVYGKSIKGGCYSTVDPKTLAHEVGHMFGAEHTQSAEASNIGKSNRCEPWAGFSVMSYGIYYYKNSFGLGSVLQINNRFYNRSGYWYWNNTEDFDQIPSQNKAPQIKREKYQERYEIPPNTFFRFKVKADDSDKNDQILYYAQQLNYKADNLSVFSSDESFKRGLIGEPLLSSDKPERTNTFYFQNMYYRGKLYSNILKNPNDNFTYDMFLMAFDKNNEKASPFFQKYDAIVSEYTTKMINNRANATEYNSLESEMRNKMSQVKNPWTQQRDIFHTKVVVKKNYTPFTLTITPNKKEYRAGETVTLSWEVDKRVVPDTDHINIRFSKDFGNTYPYLLKQNIPASQGSVTIEIPSIWVSKKYFWSGNNWEFLSQGFFMIEHKEGIVYTTTHIKDDDLENITAPTGGFVIRPSEIVTEFSLNPSEPTVGSREYLKEIFNKLKVSDKSNAEVEANKLLYFLADEGGKILRQFPESQKEEIVKYLSKGEDYQVTALVNKTNTTNDFVGQNIVDLQYLGYQDNTNNYVTNVLEVKRHPSEADTKTEPIFSIETEQCIGNASPLPNISDNNITGTWSPNYNPNEIGTKSYIFTPNNTSEHNSSSITITIKEKTKAVFAQSNYSYKECETFTPPTPTNGVLGEWTIPSSGEGVYTFTPSDNCREITTINVTKIPKVKAIFAQSNYSYKECETFIPPTSTNGVSGEWTIPSSGEGVCTFTPSDNCHEVTTINVTKISKVKAIFAQSNYSYKECETFTPPTPTNGVLGEWTIPSSGEGVYTFTPSDNCREITTINVTKIPKVKAIFSQTNYSYKECEDFIPPTPTNGVLGEWTIPPSGKGVYTFIPSDNCHEITTIQVEKVERVELSFSNLPERTKLGGNVELPQTDNNGILGSWDIVSQTDFVVSYKFIPQNIDCFIEYLISLDIVKEPKTYNFVVNGSVGNKLLFEDLDISLSNSVSIYDEMGLRVFHVENYDNVTKGFEGFGNEGVIIGGKNESLPSGTYFYVIEYQYKDRFGNIQNANKKGFLYFVK